MRSDHLSTLLLRRILPVSLAASAAVAASAYLAARGVILWQGRQSLAAATAAAAAQARAYFDQRGGELEEASRSPLFEDHYRNVEYGLEPEAREYRHEIESMLRDLALRTGAYRWLAYYDPSGRIVCVVKDGLVGRPGEAPLPETLAFFARVRRLRPGEMELSGISRLFGSPVVRYGYPFIDEGGVFHGALIAAVAMSGVTEALARLELGRSGRAVLTERRSQAISEVVPSQAGLLVSSADVPGTPWRVVTAVDSGDYLKPLTRVIVIIAALTILASALLVFVVTRQVRLLLKPLQDVASAAEAYAGGDMAARASVAGPREVASMASAFNDMADRVQARTRDLIESEKLTAVGRLISGVAHELNNPLAAVTGFAELLKEMPARVEHKEDLRCLHESALRCRDIVQGLLRFVRRSDASLRRVSLNYAVQATLALLEYRLIKAEAMRLEVELDATAPQIAADFQKLQQVLVNLLGNASDALNGRPDPRVVRVRTRAWEGGSEVVVEDNGPGVPERAREEIFAPFYTTKPAGQGTGLGLAISRQIVSEFGGKLVCEEAPGGGARFVARFPPCPRDLAEPETALKLPPSVPGRKVLAVDDEPELVKLMLRLLSEDGLIASGVTDAEEALRRLSRERFDLVVADVDLGRMRGTELIFLSGASPGGAPPFILVTGDILNDALARELASLEVPVLTKPFLRSEFLRVVRRVLHERPCRAR